MLETARLMDSISKMSMADNFAAFMTIMIMRTHKREGYFE